MPNNTGRIEVSPLKCDDFKLFVTDAAHDASPRREAEQHAAQCEACSTWLEEEGARLDQRIETLTGLPIAQVARLAFPSKTVVS